MWLSSLYFVFNSCFSLISSIMRNDYIENIFSPFSQFWLTEVSSNFLFGTNWNVGVATEVWESIPEPTGGIRAPATIHPSIHYSQGAVQRLVEACVHVWWYTKPSGCVATCAVYLLQARLFLRWRQEGLVPLIALAALCKHCNGVNWVVPLLQDMLKKCWHMMI